MHWPVLKSLHCWKAFRWKQKFCQFAAARYQIRQQLLQQQNVINKHVIIQNHLFKIWNRDSKDKESLGNRASDCLLESVANILMFSFFFFRAITNLWTRTPMAPRKSSHLLVIPSRLILIQKNVQVAWRRKMFWLESWKMTWSTHANSSNKLRGS